MSDEYATRCSAYAGIRNTSKHYRYKKGQGRLFRRPARLPRAEEKVLGHMETIFHTDHGSVYSSKAFNEFLLPYDITRTMSDPDAPTQNGAMESINGWVKNELFIDFPIKDCEDVPAPSQGIHKILQRGKADVLPWLSDPEIVQGRVL